MSKTVINIKTEKEVKNLVQKLAKDLGLSLSDVMNAALRNFIRSREVYFSHIPQMTPEFERLLGDIEKDIQIKKNLSPAFDSADKAIKYLNSL
ncbi:MAG: hypothetical protein Q8Q95_03765 [bacterium]|nr:hypothetical protein [bacterium]